MLSLAARIVMLLALLSAFGNAAWAAGPDTALLNPADEARALALFRELRCVVCQSESIADSQADLAKDLRTLVRTRIAAGDDDEAIKAFLVTRYGQYILLKPPVAPGTWLLWYGPFAFLIIGGLLAAVVLRGRGRQALEPPLTQAETQALSERPD